MNRRTFLRKLGSSGVAACCSSLMPNLVHASGNSGNGTKVLFVNLNGGLDGLYAMQPISGSTFSTLQAARPTLTSAPGSLLAGDANFSIHQNLSAFKAAFDEGKMVAVQRVGIRNMSRSHLDAETAIARGVPDRLTAASSGFLNRLGAHYGWDALQAVSVSGNDLAFEGGDFRGVQARSLADFYFRGFGQDYSERNHLVATSYSLATDAAPVAEKPKHAESNGNLRLTIDNTDLIRTAVQARTPPSTYDTSNQFGRSFKDADILFTASGFTTQVAYLRASGFDTHADQQVRLDELLLKFNSALTAFISNMKAAGVWNNLIIMVYSEFGRTNKENGSGGTDHGGANTVFLLGGPVAGGGVIGDVTSSHLTGSGWLQIRYNMVDIYRQILARIGLDPDPIFATPQEEALSSLFV